MSNRRFFLKNSLAAAVVASISPVISSFADEQHPVSARSGKTPKLRFAIASDGHYGQPGTEYKLNHDNIVKWLNEAHAQNPLNFVIINGSGSRSSGFAARS